MKRDMDLVREILLAIEGSPHAIVGLPPVIYGYTAPQISHHTHMLIEAGYLRAVVDRSHSVTPDIRHIGLTWQGHELLETIRDPEIWKTTKHGAATVGSWTMGMIGTLAKAAIEAKARELGLIG